MTRQLLHFDKITQLLANGPIKVFHIGLELGVTEQVARKKLKFMRENLGLRTVDDHGSGIRLCPKHQYDLTRGISAYLERERTKNYPTLK